MNGVWHQNGSFFFGPKTSESYFFIFKNMQNPSLNTRAKHKWNGLLMFIILQSSVLRFSESLFPCITTLIHKYHLYA